jgi:hypothetical protein
MVDFFIFFLSLGQQSKRYFSQLGFDIGLPENVSAAALDAKQRRISEWKNSQKNYDHVS